MTSNHPRILAIRNDEVCPPAWVGEWLAEAGAEVTVVDARHLTDRAGANASPAHGIVILGGRMGAHSEGEHPWLAGQKALIRQAVADGLPLLGICLGHQLMAAALGGRVHRNPAGGRQGVVPVAATALWQDDPLFGALPTAGLRAVHWNNDVIAELPPRAQVLATAPDGSVQAARFGDRAWGTQFHPEAFGDLVAPWTPPRDPDAVASVRAAEPELRETWRPLITRWLGLLQQPVPTPPPPAARQRAQQR